MNKSCNILFIPAGGLTATGNLPKFVKLRLDAAIRAFNLGKKEEKFIFLLSGRETPYKKPILDKNGFPLIEASVMAEYLVKNGINKKLIRIEKLSMDTLGGIYFSKVFFINNLSIKRIIVFTSDFHLERIKLCFTWVYRLKPFSKKYEISYVKSSDVGLTPQAIRARIKKEKTTIKLIKNLMRKLNTEKSFNEWLFTEHAGYAFGLKMFEIDKITKKTY